MLISDAVLLAEGHEDMKKVLVTLREHCDRWKLKVNTKKTMIAQPNRKAGGPDQHLVYDNTVLEEVENLKYLGFLIDSGGR